MAIGRLQSEGDLERFIEDRTTQAFTGLRAQAASLVQGQQGSVLQDSFATGEGTSSVGLAGLLTARPVVTVAVAGTYVAFFGAEFTSASAVTPAVALTINGVGAGAEHKQTLSTGTGSAQISAFLPVVLAAGDVVGLAYRSQAAITSTFSNRRLALVRLSS